MAPVGLSLVNLLIESSSLSCSKPDAKGGEKSFAQNYNYGLLSPSPTLSEAGSSKDTYSASSSPTPPPSPSPSPTGAGSAFEGVGVEQRKANFLQRNNNNNNYFSGKSSLEGEAQTHSQKLYSLFWEKFQRSRSTCDHSVGPGPGPGPAAAEKVRESQKEEKSLPQLASEKEGYFLQNLERINSKLLPLWALLAYPSDLHFWGRTAVITAVTGYVIEKTLEDLPDIGEIQKRVEPHLRCEVLDGSDPNLPGRVGVDKHFF